MKTVSGLFVFCAFFTFLVKVFAGKSPLDCLYFYPEEYQEKVYELGLTDRETVDRKRKIFRCGFISLVLILLILLVRYLEGAHDVKTAYLCCLLYLEVMNWYDGIVIDNVVVAKDPFWNIAEVKGIPYVQTWTEVLKKRVILSLIWIVFAVIPAWIVILL